jgi:hypothetical protein
MEKVKILFLVSMIIIILSANPMFQWIREPWIDKQIDERYDVRHAFVDRDGFERSLEGREITVNGVHIQVEEIPTGIKAPLTSWEYYNHKPAGDIVKIQYYMNGQPISQPDIMKIPGDRINIYYNGQLDVLKILDRQTNETSIYIVQNLMTEDLELDQWVWKVISIDSSGKVNEKKMSFKERKHYPLWVKVINCSGVTNGVLGYKSQFVQIYPTIFVPFLYPWFSTLLGILLLIITLIMWLWISLRNRRLRKRSLKLD